MCHENPSAPFLDLAQGPKLLIFLSTRVELLTLAKPLLTPLRSEYIYENLRPADSTLLVLPSKCSTSSSHPGEISGISP